MKAIETQDEELARIMQEQEQLRLKKRQEKLAARRQMSQPLPPTPDSVCIDNLFFTSRTKNIVIKNIFWLSVIYYYSWLVYDMYIKKRFD